MGCGRLGLGLVVGGGIAYLLLVFLVIGFLPVCAFVCLLLGWGGVSFVGFLFGLFVFVVTGLVTSPGLGLIVGCSLDVAVCIMSFWFFSVFWLHFVVFSCVGFLCVVVAIPFWWFLGSACS